MSIGNLKTQGGKGTNYPFQHNVLKGLQGIIDTLSGDTVGVRRRAAIERLTGPWLNAVNIFSFSVANVGIANGSCLGVTLKPGEVVNFDASALNNFFEIGTIAANGAGTELLLTYITD